LTPLVGRESEVALLLERWEQAKDGQGQVILLSGEAGIGKSRLVQVLQEYIAREQHTRWECRSSPYYQNTALYPLIDLMQRTLRWQQDETPEQQFERLEQTLSQYRLPLAETVPLFANLLSLPVLQERYPPLPWTPQRQRQKTLESLVAILLELAESQPVVLILEDLHWVDPTTLEFLTLLIDQAPTAALYILLTCRPESQPPWSHRSYLTEIMVDRLSRKQIERVAEHVSGGKKLPPEVLRQIVEKTDGVPLFVEEITKAILESGVLKETNEHYELAGAFTTVALPATLQDSLMARLDRLVSAKGIAQLGAAIGRQFSYALLHAVSQLEEDTLHRELSRLVEAELLYQHGLPPQEIYTFKHALIRDAAYQSLLKRTRQQYHQNIAQTLTERFVETAENQPELLAHHLTEAGLVEQAVGLWSKAGAKASERSAYVEAIAHLRKGLELLQVLPATSARDRHELLLQCTLAASLTVTHGYTAPEVGQTYMRAHQLCQEIGEPPQLFPVLDGLRRFYVNRGEVQTARELGEQLLSLAQRQPDTRLVQQAHFSLGHAVSLLGEFPLARAHLEQSMAYYTPQPLTTQASLDLAGNQIASLIVIAPVLWSLGYPDQALARIHDALSLTHELAHPFILAVVLPVAARLHQFRREVQAAKEQAEAVITLANEQGFAQQSSEGAIYLGWAMTMQDQDEAGVAQLCQGLDAYRATGAEQGMSHLLVLLAEAYGNLGHNAEGLAVLTETLAQVEKSGERRVEAELHRLKGEFLLKQSSDSTPEAETCFQQAISIAQRQQAKSWELRAATSLAHLWQQQGKRQEAYDLLAPVYNWFTEGFDTADLQEARALLDALQT
jgi:predicted ATPase